MTESKTRDFFDVLEQIIEEDLDRRIAEAQAAMNIFTFRSIHLHRTREKILKNEPLLSLLSEQDREELVQKYIEEGTFKVEN